MSKEEQLENDKLFVKFLEIKNVFEYKNKKGILFGLYIAEDSDGLIDYDNGINFITYNNSIENLFKEYSDRKILFNALFQYLSKDLMRSLKDGNLSTKDIQEFQHIIPGMVRAISEYEYMIGPLDYPSPITVATVGIPEEPFRYITMDEVKGYNVRRRRLLATIANKNKPNKK